MLDILKKKKTFFMENLYNFDTIEHRICAHNVQICSQNTKS